MTRREDEGRAPLTEEQKELRRRWVEALRSGKYQQGRDYLCTVNPDGTKTYCCLGVLLDIIHPDWWRRDLTRDLTTDGTQEIQSWIDPANGFVCKTRLDTPQMRMVDLTDHEMAILIANNDSCVVSFDQIAKKIEDDTIY